MIDETEQQEPQNPQSPSPTPDSQPAPGPNRRRRHRGRGRGRQGPSQPQQAGTGPPQGPSDRRDDRGPQHDPESRPLPPIDESTLELSESFRALGLNEPALKAIAAMGFEEPTPIQEEMIPLALAGNDVLGQARTGTGKTAAFGLPILLQANREHGTQALILVPTRELAMQVSEEIAQLARYMPIECVAVFGGAPVGPQMRRLTHNPQIVVGTPGRVMDMLGRGALKLNELRWAVLDEVDRMLDIGFRDDIRFILGQIRDRVQTMFVSATLPDDVNRLVEQYSHDLKRVTLSSDRLTVEHVKQFYVSVEGWDKYHMLRKLLAAEQPDLAIIFTNTRFQTGRVCERLQNDGISALHIHGDLLQKQRDRVMQSFREQRIHVLVATDLVGRGIDVDGITHIINYDMPFDAELYVHRIGRTARMGAVGVAISLVTPEEGPELTEIEKMINVQLQPMQVAGFTPSPPPPMEFARRQAEQQATEARNAAPPVRGQEPVFADEEFQEQHGLPPKTLGSKFKTPQRRKTKKLKRR